MCSISTKVALICVVFSAETLLSVIRVNYTERATVNFNSLHIGLEDVDLLIQCGLTNTAAIGRNVFSIDLVLRHEYSQASRGVLQ